MSGNSTYAQTPVQVTLELPAEASPNSDFTVKVNISQVTGFDAASYNISFDSALLRLDNVTSGQLGSAVVPVDIWNAKSAGVFVIVQNIPGVSGVSGSGYLAVLHFHNISSQNRTVSISLSNGTLGNNMAQAIPAAWNGATLNVVGSSPPASAVPQAPASVTITGTGVGQVGLTWVDNTNNESGFIIQRAADAAFALNMVAFTVAANTTTYTDATVASATTYYYRVFAYNASGNSAASNMVMAAIPSPPPPAYSPPSPATSTPSPAPAVSTANVSAMIDTGGKFKQDMVIEPAQGKARLVINKETVALTRERAPVSQITVAEVAKPPTPTANSRIVGKAYDFGPNGAIFTPPIKLTLAYTLADIPQGFNEKELVIAHWNADTGAYSALPDGVVDPVSYTISAPVNHFSAFAIVAPAPPSFSVKDLAVSPTEVVAGEAVTIKVVVSNTGGREGSYEAILKLGSTVEATNTVKLASGGNKQLTFSVSKTPGSYTVNIGGLSGAFDVKPAPAVPSPSPVSGASPPPEPPIPTLSPSISAQVPASPPEATSEAEPQTVNWPVLWSAIGVVAIVLLLVILIRARSR
ncbi:MAG: hypothetical protein HYX79_08430 [Chloroflexi bacterium]|nr:hypothetical protein [Chloroflexota bacterium]